MEILRDILLKEIPEAKAHLERCAPEMREGRWYLDLSFPKVSVVVWGSEEKNKPFVYHANALFSGEDLGPFDETPDLRTDSLDRMVGYIVGIYGKSNQEYLPEDFEYPAER